MKRLYNIHLIGIDNNDVGSIILQTNSNTIHSNYINRKCDSFSESCELYITIPESNSQLDKINKDDWFINYQLDGSKALWQHHGELEPHSNPEKVIATTNKRLSIKPIPSLSIKSIPRLFIDNYITEYNKGNIITSMDLDI